MAINIFNVQPKKEINVSLQGKSIAVVGKTKVGKSTLCAGAPKCAYIAIENGLETITGDELFVMPVNTWSDFRSVVSQLATTRGREMYDTVVIDSYTNLLLLLEKYIGAKISTEKVSFEYASDADYGKGMKPLKNELGTQLQKLTNAGFLLLNIIHAEDKTDFTTQKAYIGTSLSSSVYGVAEKFVDQTIYLSGDRAKKEYFMHFTPKSGFEGTGGRFAIGVEKIETSFKNLEKVLLDALRAKASETGAVQLEQNAPIIVIPQEEYSFDGLLAEFNTLTQKIVGENSENASKIREIISRELGAGKTVAQLTPSQVELLASTITTIKQEFGME